MIAAFAYSKLKQVKHMNKHTVLIVDDEKNTRDGLSRALRRHYNVLLAEQGERALEIIDQQQVDLVLSDVRMPGMDGLTLLKRILARDPQPVCILLTAYGSVEMAVDAMKNGAYDYLTKPVNLDRLEMLVRRALREKEMQDENQQLQEQLDSKFGMENIIGNSPIMQQVFDTIRQASPSKATILIEGESGTGKELVAQAIHRLSPRSNAPFVPVHCAALSEALLESELFGHEKGAFTGATATRKGRFERADGGTLFLDEIGEIDANTQVKLLRALEERKFERVGGDETIEVDVRLIAATNKNLKTMVDEGKFREDLYYRLKVVSIDLPSLNKREEDLPLLAKFFIKQLSEENGVPEKSISAEALEALIHYDWPGNIRELRNVVERMVVLTSGDRITLRDIPSEVRSERPSRQASQTLSLEDNEKELIIQALTKHRGNRTRAAEQLGISRRTLHRKLNEYELRDI